MKAKDYTQISAVAADNQPLPGVVNTTPEWDTFTLQMAYQHVNTYLELLHIPDVKVITDLLAAAKPAKVCCDLDLVRTLRDLQV